MTASTTFHCDRCHTSNPQETAARWTRINVQFIGYMPFDAVYPEASHLCGECTHALARWLKQEVVA